MFLRKINSWTRLLSCCFCLVSFKAQAVTQYKDGPNRFILDPAKLKPSLTLPVTDTIEQVKVPAKVVKTRIIKSDADKRIEDVQIRLPKDPKKIGELAGQLAKAKKSSALFDYFMEQAEKVQAQSDGSKRVKINKDAYQWIKSAELAKMYTRPHHNVEILTRELGNNKEVKRELFAQVQNFLDPADKRRVVGKFKNGEPVSLENDLLPEFAKKTVKKFLVFRGPNCFHAALAFHGQTVTRSKFFNVKEEEGYHRSMINYDELWRAINAAFYEVNPERSDLQYGDMLVFFDLPKDHEVTNFRWIRHAATYLVGPYTFSKGSKSPDTPYTIKTLDEEWTTWRKFSKNLGAKVFRRNNPTVTKIPPLDLTDWLY